MNPATGMQPPQLNVPIEQLVTAQCQECGGEIFAEGLLIKKISALLTANGQAGIVPIQAFYCVKCAAVLEEFLPEGVKKTKIVG